MVHFGLGAFHRAHQAVYTEAAGDWGIAAVAPRSMSIVEAMRAQNCRYTVTDRVPGPLRPRVVGSIVEALHMRADAGRVLDLVAAPEVTVVTLTITEKAHYRRVGAGLDLDAPEIAADLAGSGPATVVGMLARGLAERFRRGGAPVSVVSCDNMAANGAVVAGVVRDFVAASRWPDRDAVLDWLATSVAFPSTIVDRIVPATTPEDVVAVAEALGYRDEVPVLGEPYREWVLEDAFAAERPRWERAGAVLVPDVTPYQLRKLRLLNGSHSAMAYLGAAAGCATVADVLATGWGERLVRGFCAEVAETLPDDQGSYVDSLVARFANPAIRHRLSQIGSDGSLKIAERWFDPLREIPAGSAPLLELALAGWVNATRPQEQGKFGMTDPAAERLAACWRNESAIQGVASGPRYPLSHEAPTVSASRDRAVVARLLRVAGAPDLAERADLVSAVADRLPALAAGRIEF
jgi:fructuronate reductase